MRPYHALLGSLLAMLAILGLSCNKSINAKSDKGKASATEREVESRPNSKAKIGSAAFDAAYDFGSMEVGEVGKHTFKITSVGDEPLELKQGGTTCKCTIAGLSAGGKKVDKEKSLILKKGETASIDLEWTPKANQEMFRQTAVIYTSDPEQPKIELSVTGQVKQLITLLPQGVWPLGPIDGEKPSASHFAIGSSILKEFKITELSCTDKSIKLDKTPLPKEDLKSSGYKCGYKITVTVLPKDTIGHFQEKITIKTDARDGLTFMPELTGVRNGPVLIRAAQGVLWQGDSMRLSLGRFSASKGKSVELRL
jgi:Protein of unknown function (DUF1573)